MPTSAPAKIRIEIATAEDQKLAGMRTPPFSPPPPIKLHDDRLPDLPRDLLPQGAAISRIAVPMRGPCKAQRLLSWAFHGLRRFGDRRSLEQNQQAMRATCSPKERRSPESPCPCEDPAKRKGSLHGLSMDYGGSETAAPWDRTSKQCPRPAPPRSGDLPNRRAHARALQSAKAPFMGFPWTTAVRRPPLLGTEPAGNARDPLLETKSASNDPKR